MKNLEAFPCKNGYPKTRESIQLVLQYTSSGLTNTKFVHLGGIPLYVYPLSIVCLPSVYLTSLYTTKRSRPSPSVFSVWNTEGLVTGLHEG